MIFGLKRERSLAEWLEYQQQTHPQTIALGLDRVRSVATRLELRRPGRWVITVGGTNGKGSTVAFLQAMAMAAGLKVGCYTSPHLLRYNERVTVDGAMVDDALLVAAFERIQAARGEIALTYFEWGTLAALLIFADAGLDLAVLEVGLGGRLDAVNIIDADAAILSSVALDHTEYLGADREAIGREKVGIFRPKRWAVLAELDPPDSVLQAAARMGAKLLRRGRDFKIESRSGGRWLYSDKLGNLELPPPALSAPVQSINAAAAMAALRHLLAIKPAALLRGVETATLPGRLQRVLAKVDVWLDVAHNPHAVMPLAKWLAEHPIGGRTRAVFAALNDKDVAGLVAPLREQVQHWYLAALPQAGPRGQSAAALQAQLADTLAGAASTQHDAVASALDSALGDAEPGDRVLVYGSFYTVAAALESLAAAG